MGKKAGNRKHSKIDALDPALRETVEQMLLSGSTYSEIVDFLGANGVGISVASVCRYARAYQAEVQMLNMAQENFRRMMDELDKRGLTDNTIFVFMSDNGMPFPRCKGTLYGRWGSIKPTHIKKGLSLFSSRNLL